MILCDAWSSYTRTIIAFTTGIKNASTFLLNKINTSITLCNVDLFKNCDYHVAADNMAGVPTYRVSKSKMFVK